MPTFMHPAKVLLLSTERADGDYNKRQTLLLCSVRGKKLVTTVPFELNSE